MDAKRAAIDMVVAAPAEFPLPAPYFTTLRQATQQMQRAFAT
jgi:hypothetical protein